MKFLYLFDILRDSLFVIPAKAGIYKENHSIFRFPIKTFGNDKKWSFFRTVNKHKYLVRNLSLIILSTVFLIFCQKAFADQAVEAMAKVPIQHNGRVKSFDLFARETLHLISGKETWERKPAAEFFLNLLEDPEKIIDQAIIRVDYLELKKQFGFPAEKKYFSYSEIKPYFSSLVALAQSAQQKRDSELHPTMLELKAESLYQSLMMVDQLAAGEVFKFIAQADNEQWLSPYQDDRLHATGFRQMTRLYSTGAKEDFVKAVGLWIDEMKKISKAHFNKTIQLEIFYYQLKPFFYSWILYLLGFAMLLCTSQKSYIKSLGLLAALMGFLFHSAGLGLRILILERPPVSNMYESMIFMNWVLMICAIILFCVKRNYVFITVASIVSALVMIYADLLPIDQSLGVLVPVLRSNYWLTIHVMTIVASYGIFGLAMALGHRHLFLSVTKKLSSESDSASADALNRLLQAGVITLGIGTVLGGVWANESWGRFWGWDPKETWALITFLGYLVVLHLRTAGKLGDFGLACCSVLGFLLVLMTWYGVNFVLGKGLHSYGFGAGGIVWIVYYLLFEFCFFAFVVSRKVKNFKNF